MDKSPVGVFDSGVGGLSVLTELRRLLPSEEYLYVADQAHVPYGLRSREEVRRYCFEIVDFLLRRGSKLVVVACNTASAAALQPLRTIHPNIPFVGMEPAVKPAAEESRRGVIGVIATEATFQGELFASVVHRYARGVKVVTHTVPGLVEWIEAGETEGPALEAMLRVQLQPLLDAGIDELVLGCTHYPFARQALQNVVGPDVKIIDPGPAIARRTAYVLAKRNLCSVGGPGSVLCFTSGDPDAFSRVSRKLLEVELTVRGIRWPAGSTMEGELIEPEGNG
jgi:glutamate racemase